MGSDSGFRSAFLVSLLSHSLLFGITTINHPVSKDKKIPEDIFLNLEIEPPALLPRIEIMADEKRFKPERSSETVTVEPSSQGGVKAPIQEQREEVFGAKESIERTENRQKVIAAGDFLDNTECLRYQDMVKQKIEERRIYPDWARRQRIEGITGVGFIVLASGEAQEIRLISSSGSSLLDQETINTIKRASPFPPIPEGIKADFIYMDVSLVFTLNN